MHPLEQIKEITELLIAKMKGGGDAIGDAKTLQALILKTLEYEFPILPVEFCRYAVVHE